MDTSTQLASLQHPDSRKCVATTASVLSARTESAAWLRPIVNLGDLRTLPIDEKWYSLGVKLGINFCELDTIQQSHPNNLFKCKVEMLKTWLHGDKTASRRQLSNALNSINEGSLANDVLSWHNVENHSNERTHSHDTPSRVKQYPNKVAADVTEPDGISHQVQKFIPATLTMKEPPTSVIMAIKENYPLLLTLLPGMEIVPQMHSKALISRADYQNILAKRTTHECNMILLDSIQRAVAQSPESFEVFLHVLMEHPNCIQIPEILRQSVAQHRESAPALHTQTKTDDAGTDSRPHSSLSSGELTPVSSELKVDDYIPGSPDYIKLSCSSSSADSFHSVGDNEIQYSGDIASEKVATVLLGAQEMFFPSPFQEDESELHSDNGKGSSINSRRSSTQSQITVDITPLQNYLDVVLKGSEDIVSKLLSDNKVNVDDPLKDGMTALMLASIEGHSGVIKILLEFHASVNLTDKNGSTPLHLAASKGNYEPVKQLVAAFSDVNATTRDGSSVLLLPSSKGFSVIVQYLLENAANPNIANQLGYTPLIVAAAKNHKDVVEVLLEYKADVMATTFDTSKTALQEAIDHNYTEIVEILTKATAIASNKSRALFFCQTAERVQELLNEGAKVNDRRGDGSTPLIAHAESGNLSVVMELLHSGANVDEKDQSQMTALMKASKQGFTEIVEALIAAQSILDLKSQMGKTALMYATQNKHTTVVKCLVEAGANISIKDKSGQTALEIANEVKCQEIVTFLHNQTALATDSKDPFMRVLSVYLDKLSKEQAKSKNGTVNKPSKGVTASKQTTPKAKDDERSTLKDQLTKAWKRIADLETRIHDLTLQSTMELPPEVDLSYFDRGRLEAEYRKLKELKKKSEQYAIEAKQTAQRLSAENFKLKEDMMRERHAHEIQHKGLLSEMEEKFDRAAIASTVRQDQAEVFEREVYIKAQELAKLEPIHLYITQQNAAQYKPEDIKDLILTHAVRANIVQVGVGGLPYSGKTTLSKSLLKLSESDAKLYIRRGFENGLSMYEAVRMRDKVVEVSEWIPATKEDAIFISVAAALAQVCLQKHTNPSLTDIHTLPNLFNDRHIDAHFSEVLKGVEKLMCLIKDHKATPAVLSRASLTYINLMDVGHNKALYEVLTIFASGMKNFLLIDVLNLERDSVTLRKKHDLTDESVYPMYKARGNNKLFHIRSTLAYYIMFMFTVRKTTDATDCPSALLVGTHADCFSDPASICTCTEARKEVLKGVKARVNDYGLADVINPGIVAVNARNSKSVCEVVRKALDKLIDENHRFERDIRLSWIFLRTVLSSMKKMYMPKSELLVYGKKCGLKNKKELEDFLVLFKDVGSILYSPTDECRILHENIVLEPVSFIHGMDKLYYAEYPSKDVPDYLKPDYELLPQGFITVNLAHHLWSDEHDFYLQVLEAIRVIVRTPSGVMKLPDIPHSNTIFFMPTLRPNFYHEKPSKDCNSLIISGESFHQGHIIVHRQSEFLLYLLNHYSDSISLKRNKEYNVMHFQWHDVNDKQQLQANIFIRFVVVYAEIEIQPRPPYKMEDFDFLRHALKTACIEIFGTSNEYFNLGFICPNSNGQEYPDGLHFLPFHPLAQERDKLYCHHKCGKFIPLNEERRRWIRAPYKGPQECLPGDCLSLPMADEIAQELSNLTESELHILAGTLGFTEKEVNDKLHSQPSTCDVLLMLLLRFRQWKPVTARKSLAEALLKCNHYTMALKLHPKFLIGSVRIHHPLTSKEFAVISQYIPDWQRLAEYLKIPPYQIKCIEQQYKSVTEQCYQMLTSWEKNYSAQHTAKIAKASADLSQSTPSSLQSSSDYSSLSDDESSHFTDGMKSLPCSEQIEFEDVHEDARTTLVCALNKTESQGQKLAAYLETGHSDMLLK